MRAMTVEEMEMVEGGGWNLGCALSIGGVALSWVALGSLTVASGGLAVGAAFAGSVYAYAQLAVACG